MNASKYQILASRTLLKYPGFELTDEEIMLLWDAFGLAGEAGEVVEVIKKVVFHRHALDDAKLKKELGDVCWYVAALCSTLGYDLSDVMAENIEKLKVRYPDGFKSEDSVKRVDVT